jgi:superfamily II DNA/RNA helicase
MTQGLRNRTLGQLRTGRLRMLVATDVAARGIDVPTISHVINFGLPMSAEDYVHRIGRTGRAGRSGLAITLAAHADVQAIRRIERFTTQPIAASVIEGLEPKRSAAPSSKPRGFGGRGRPEGGAGKPGARANATGYAGRVHNNAAPRPASAHPGPRTNGAHSSGTQNHGARPGAKGRPAR